LCKRRHFAEHPEVDENQQQDECGETPQENFPEDLDRTRHWESING
jgi:hypothetical protein